MKQIIDGKVYNTETAEKLGRWGNNQTDFGSCTETLYRTKRGRYFIYGSGGPMSKYATSEGGGSYSGGDGIIPLTKEEAQEWAEKHICCDDYEAAFGPVPEA